MRIEDRDDRMIVWLDQPAVRNAIDAGLVRDLDDVCARLEQTPKPLLVTSDHGYFAAGADIRELAGAGRDFALHGRTRGLFARVSALPMPTVAAVDGFAIGGGAELAYACDLRIASDRAVFANPEPALGITAAAGGCWRLPELVGPAMAKLMLFTGHRLAAQDALRCGLVADVVPAADLMDTAHALIDRMGRASAAALRVTKIVLDARGAHPAADALAQALLLEDDEKRARMAGFLNKRQG
ncbi:enoyl-CoA hydratase/isomerase family protein [Actinophytocola sediminis]